MRSPKRGRKCLACISRVRNKASDNRAWGLSRKSGTHPWRRHSRGMGRAQGLSKTTGTGHGRRPTRRINEQATKWTDARLRADLEAFLGAVSEWPSRSQFMAAGKYGLWMAVRDHGGHLYWAEALGKTVSSAQQPRGVPVDDLVREARAVIAEHGRLPNQEMLRILGFPRLATAVKRAGGARKFMQRHGL